MKWLEKYKPFSQQEVMGIFVYEGVFVKTLLEKYLELKHGKPFAEIDTKIIYNEYKDMLKGAILSVEYGENMQDVNNFLNFRNKILFEIYKELENADINARTH